MNPFQDDSNLIAVNTSFNSDIIYAPAQDLFSIEGEETDDGYLKFVALMDAVLRQRNNDSQDRISYYANIIFLKQFSSLLFRLRPPPLYN